MVIEKSADCRRLRGIDTTGSMPFVKQGYAQSWISDGGSCALSGEGMHFSRARDFCCTIDVRLVPWLLVVSVCFRPSRF